MLPSIDKDGGILALRYEQQAARLSLALGHLIGDNIPIDVHGGANLRVTHQLLLNGDRCSHCVQLGTERVTHGVRTDVAYISVSGGVLQVAPCRHWAVTTGQNHGRIVGCNRFERGMVAALAEAVASLVPEASPDPSGQTQDQKGWLARS